MTETLTIADCLHAAPQLAAVSDSPRLDVEIFLAHILEKSRTYLFTWPEKTLTTAQAQSFETCFQRRLQGEPVAHIVGQREFWSLSFFVDNTTLIPRPDTELLVESALIIFSEDAPEQPRAVLDLGTGTGAILLALAHEKKHWNCVGVDKSPAAVALAEKNRVYLQVANAGILQSDWFASLGSNRFDIIVSNPPYIDPADPHLQQGDVRFEPATALVAGNNGLADIEWIAQHSPNYLLPDGWLLIEHGYDQGDAVRELFAGYGFAQVKTLRDFGDNERVTLGQISVSGLTSVKGKSR